MNFLLLVKSINGKEVVKALLPELETPNETDAEIARIMAERPEGVKIA